MAVDNARNLVKEAFDDISEDTIGQRLLGMALALWEEAVLNIEASQSRKQKEAERVKKIKQAADAIMEATEIHTRTGRWQNLARLAYAVATADVQGQMPEAIAQAAKGAADAAVTLVRGSGEVPAQEGNTLAQLCIAIGKLYNDKGVGLWALGALPHVDITWLIRVVEFLEAQLKMNGPEKNDGEEEMLKDLKEKLKEEQKKNSPAAGPKAVHFVLDASGSMAGTRLATCKTAIHNILDNYIDDKDTVGFLAFAHYSKDIFPLQLKVQHNVRTVQQLHRHVDSVETFGRTAFYDAVKQGLGQLGPAVDPGIPKWLVALTDGADTDSSSSSASAAEGLIRATPNMNVAVITVGDLPHQTIGVVNRWVQAAQSAGCTGVHVPASDADKIREAFESIAEMMADDGLTEHL